MKGVDGEAATEAGSPPVSPGGKVSPDPDRGSPVTADPDRGSPVTADPYRGSPDSPRTGTVIPNRLFVGRIDFRTTESDMWRFFSQHGVVREVNIVLNHLGISKGYGFVTFNTQEAVQRILHDAKGLYFQSKMLTVGLAVRRQHRRRRSGCREQLHGSGMAPPCSTLTLHLTTATGHPYTYHNGVAYFHSPDVPSPVHPCTTAVSAPPVVFPQQPACHHFQCSERSSWLQFTYRPQRASQYVEHMVHPAYHQVYAQRPTPMCPHQEYGEVGYY